jgi:hypothetical protein
VIADTHHPNLRGQVALAQAVLRELVRHEVFGASYRFEQTFDAAACADHFGMDALRWGVMCAQTSDHYGRVAGYRFDPTERLAKSRRYAEAAKKIRSGVAPERAGIPGFGFELPARDGDQGEKTAPVPGGAISPDAGKRPSGARGASHAPSFGDLFDLPVLEQDRRTSAQESDGCREMISVGTSDHFTNEPGERTIQHAYRGADRDGGFFRDDKAGVDHRVNLMKVAGQGILIGDFEHGHQPVSAESDESILRAPVQENVAREERNDRFDSPSLRRMTFFFCLRKEIGDIRLAQLAGDCFLLARLGVQAPPEYPGSPSRCRKVFPEVGGETVGLGRKNGHRLVGSGKPAAG